MTLTQLLADCYRRLNHPTSPPSAVTTRLTAFLNDAHRQILTRPGMERLRDDVMTFASVANQARYGLPPNIARIKSITDRTNDLRLALRTLDTLRSEDPGLTASGTPDGYVPISYQPVAVQPSAATGIWAVSSSASDTAGPTVSIDTFTTGGYRHTPSATALTGTSRVQLGSRTDIIEITKFILSASCVGYISLYDAATNGNELARIEPGKTAGRYVGIQLDPVPSAAITYYVDYTRVIPDLSAATDEPLLPEDFHWVLVAMACRMEYAKTDDTRYAQMVAEEERGVRALRSWVLYPPDFRAVSGVEETDRSNLGSWYPSGTW